MTVGDLEAIGVTRMDADAISDFLASQAVGVLGLPDESGPYLVPLSYAFDGADRFYFTFLLGEDSHKQHRSERADAARFLVYEVTSPFFWESVLCTGRLRRLATEEISEIRETLDQAWRPAIFRNAELSGGTDIYEFEITERTGLKHTGLPPDVGNADEEA